MYRNAAQMCDALDELIDRVKNPRLNDAQRSLYLQFAQGEIIDRRYDPIKTPQDQTSFESVQRVKDDLSAIVKEATGLTPTSNTLDLPADYLHLLQMDAVIDGDKKYGIEAISFDELPTTFKNPFTAISPDYPRWTQSSTGIKIRCGFGVVSSIDLTYLRIPAAISKGTTSYTNAQTFTNGDILYVDSGTVTYNSIVYTTGQTFTIAIGTGLVFTGSGTAVILINCELSAGLHDEIIRTAAAIANGVFEDYNKQKMYQAEAQKA